MRPRRATARPHGRRGGMPDEHDESDAPPDTQPLFVGEPYVLDDDERIEVMLEWAPVVGLA